MHIAYHLEVLQQGFQFDTFNENIIKNLDEIHFTTNMDNGRTSSFKGDKSVKNADAVVGWDAMTMFVRIFMGHRLSIEVPMIIFTNNNNNYLICGLDFFYPRSILTYRSKKYNGPISIFSILYGTPSLSIQHPSPH